MPIAWRYLLSHYFKIFLLSLSAFIAILIVSRLSEIAQVISMGAPRGFVFRFVLYQIPLLLPFAIPISCLIAAQILYQHLSTTQELTALRAAGVSLWQTLLPILFAGGFLALSTFYITSEIASSAQLATRKMLYDYTTTNPILLLQNQKIAQYYGAYIQMDPVRNGESAKNVVVAVGKDRVTLCLAQEISREGGSLIAHNATVISSLPSDKGTDFLLENQKRVEFFAAEISSLFKKKNWKIAHDHLRFSLLKIKLKQAKHLHCQKCLSEMARRISLGISALTFTFMGAAFGMRISRRQTKKGLLSVCLLCALTLITFFIAKELDHIFWISSLLFFLPHAIITTLSVRTLYQINQGIE